MRAVLFLCSAFVSRTIWLNVLFSTSIIMCRASLPEKQLQACNSSESPKIYHDTASADEELSEEAFSTATAVNETDIHWSKLVFQNCSVNITLLCDASYPVEWVEENDQDLDLLFDVAGTNITKHIYTERIVNDTLLEHSDISSINLNAPSFSIFRAVLKVIYNYSTPFCAAANYTCRSVNHPCLQSKKIISVVDQAKQIIKYEPFNGPQDDLDMDDDIDDQCATTIEVVRVKTGELGWKCRSSEKKRKLVINLQTCDAAVHCNAHFSHSKNCVNRLPDAPDCKSCVFAQKDFKNSEHPGFVWCESSDSEDGNHTIVAVAHYFFSIPQTNDDAGELPELYVHWDEADPQKMLFLEPLPDEIFIGEKKTISCRVSRYYFSYGYRFAFQYRNGTMRYSSNGDGKHVWSQNVNRVSTSHLFNDSTLERVYCIAPVWNSKIWVNQSTEVHFRHDAILPYFTVNKSGLQVPGNNHEDYTFHVHQRNATLSCSGSGIPLPEIKWSFNKQNDVVTTELAVEPGRKDLIFQYVTGKESGEYICTATNFLGTVQKRFTVDVEDPLANFIRASLILIGIIVFISIAIFSLCWRKLQRQKAKLRALTDAEVFEFKRGNVQMLENTQYLDTDELLQALPYNDEYEIPSKCLYVDPSEILGSGNFGIVLKGTVFDKQTRRKSSVVAVKTTKPKFDVNFFQTLLTEVKIMAYIGQHPNIVSLVGACTENIKNRQIYIAVEYCANGSLEKVLRNNRSTFINLICGDTFNMTTSFCDHEQIHAYENSDTSLELTTIHLLKWSREIANGMDFLGSKKIVHGDLASRNVLLTHNNVAKIGDFGLSRVLMKYSNYTRSTQDDCFLAFKWMAPETLLEMKFSALSDVWSYGVTIWEIFSLAQHPYPGVTFNSGFIEWLKSGHRLDKPYYANSEIYNLIMECCSYDPSHRIPFTELKDTFDGFLMQATNGDYVHTKEIGSSRYINGSHSLRVHNPGYSLIGGENLLFDNDNDEIGTQTALLEVLPTAEDYQGYLRPLKLDFENNLTGCD